MGRRILSDLPYQPIGQIVRLHTGKIVEFHSYQVVIWVAVTRGNEKWARADHPLFPAILDTGTNRACYLHERHLREWAGVEDPWTPAPSSGGHYLWHEDEAPIPTWRLHAHKVWLFPNRPGAIEIDASAEPFDLHAQPTFFPLRPTIKLRNKRLKPPPGPRVPVLGLPAFERRRLHLHIDTGARSVMLSE